MSAAVGSEALRPTAILDENGRFLPSSAGFSTRGFQHGGGLRRATVQMPVLRRWTVIEDGHIASLAIYARGLLAQAQWSVYDLASGDQMSRQRLFALQRGLEVAGAPDASAAVHHRDLGLSFHIEGENCRVRCDLPLRAGGRLRVDAIASQHESQAPTVVQDFGGRRFAWFASRPALFTGGYIQSGVRRIPLATRSSTTVDDFVLARAPAGAQLIRFLASHGNAPEFLALRGARWQNDAEAGPSFLWRQKRQKLNYVEAALVFRFQPDNLRLPWQIEIAESTPLRMQFTPLSGPTRSAGAHPFLFRSEFFPGDFSVLQGVGAAAKRYDMRGWCELLHFPRLGF